jgi:hypothetical protein
VPDICLGHFMFERRRNKFDDDIHKENIA